jgi:surface polysaccharide O-acyltransferase-like enzyme
MLFSQLLFSLLIALLLTVIFAAGVRRHRARAVLLGFFFIVFLATWAGGLWIVPFGARAGGVAWMSFLAVGLLVALLLTALIPPPKAAQTPEETSRREKSETAVILAFDIFFWVLLIILGVIIIAHYLRRPF